MILSAIVSSRALWRSLSSRSVGLSSLPLRSLSTSLRGRYGEKWERDGERQGESRRRHGAQRDTSRRSSDRSSHNAGSGHRQATARPADGGGAFEGRGGRSRGGYKGHTDPIGGDDVYPEAMNTGGYRETVSQSVKVPRVKTINKTDVISWTSFEYGVLYCHKERQHNRGTETLERIQRLYNTSERTHPMLLNQRIVTMPAKSVLQIFERQGYKFTHVNLASAIYRVVTHSLEMNDLDGVSNDERMFQLLTLAADNIDGFDTESVCHIAVSVARLKIPEGTAPLMMVLGNKFLSTPSEEIEPVDINNMAWAFSKACKYNAQVRDSPIVDEVFSRISNIAAEQIHGLKPMEISGICWAFANAQKPSNPSIFFDAVADRILQKQHKHHGTYLLEKFSPKNFSNMFWAFATANYRRVTVFSRFEEQVERNEQLMKDMTGEDIAKLLWSYTELNVPSQKMYEKLCHAANARAARLDAGQVNTILSSVVKFDSPNPINLSLRQSVCDAIGKNYFNVCQRATVQELCSIIYSYGRCNMEAKSFLPVAAQRLREKMMESEGTPHLADYSKAIWALTHVGVPNKELVHNVMDMIRKDHKSLSVLSVPQLSRLLWSVCMDEYYLQGDRVMTSELTMILSALREQLVLIDDASVVPASATQQLHQAALSIKLQVPQMGHLFASDWFMPFWQKADKLNYTPSPLKSNQSEISSKLAEISYTNEAHFPLEGYTVDVMVPARKMVMLLQPPSAYTLQRNLSGYSILKIKHLEMLGWRVISIPHWKWEKVRLKDSEAKAYLRNVIAIAEKPGYLCSASTGGEAHLSSTSSSFKSSSPTAEDADADADADAAKAAEREKRLFRPQLEREEDESSYFKTKGSRQGSGAEKKLRSPVAASKESASPLSGGPVKVKSPPIKKLWRPDGMTILAEKIAVAKVSKFEDMVYI